jgi:cytochrome P450
MAAAADRQAARWRSSAPGSVQPVDRAMTDATYEVITRSILGGTLAREDAVIKREAHRLLSWSSWEVVYALLHLPTSLWHPGKRPLRLAATRLRTTVHGLLARRRAAADGPRDLLGRLLAARDPETGEPMSDEQLVDNLLTFLLAGHETTAKALTWTLYLLARSPGWQQRVRAEVQAMCGAGPVTARHLAELKLTQQVLKESMRLYPPAPVMSRLVGRDLELRGHRLPAGALIVIPVFAVHRHRKLWADPDRFDPTRFAPEAEAEHLRTQFMPFGFGPRTCIGMAFAMIEAVVMLATLVRAARFDWDGRHRPEPVSRVTLQARGGMPLIVTPLP